ncbi:hypothetical protein N7449_006771 [Penicillium cf. viridicatum]|uniref:Uncharacterized protein n=1 Tax=Penicillium cf. viridicatum TaxID=2972119 RepID=A0A9W9JH67_9EURO|nr:hypothetical protein N7449_006771 [Penicillium cf. viridicatum]
MPQPSGRKTSQYWTVVISLLLPQEDRMAMQDTLRFVARLHGFNESVQELEDAMEKGLFMKLADKWFAMMSEDLDAEEDYIEDDLEDNWDMTW